MNNSDIRTLTLLEAIEKGEACSQRNLAKILNVSVGLVNSIIKRLAKIDCLTIRSLSKNRVEYKLTPQGKLRKKKLSHEYMNYCAGLYGSAKNKIRRWLYDLINNETVQRVIIIGADELTDLVVNVLNESSLSAAAIIDPENAGGECCGITTGAISDLNVISYDAVLILQEMNENKIMPLLAQNGVPDEKIYRLP